MTQQIQYRHLPISATQTAALTTEFVDNFWFELNAVRAAFRL